MPCVTLMLTAAALLTDAHARPPAPEPAKVMTLGECHFKNPGSDVIRSEIVDVTTDGNQA